MSNIWIVTIDEGYGTRIQGVYSSEKKAKAAMDALGVIEGYAAFELNEYTVDERVPELIGDLKQLIEGYERTKMLLENLKEP